MDAVELGRQRAAELHQDLLESGGDPWQPLNLVSRAAERLAIELNAVAPGSPQLAGALASFDPDLQSIVYGKTANDFHDANLIAHELGHAILGDRRARNATDVADPERPSEGSLVGEERIVDYSRKARREVQMDLFARELLIPRSFVKRLHMEHGMSASDIARKLDAPFAVVAQQLLDALLLPAAVLARSSSAESPLNEIQQNAAAHRGPAFLLNAGPGTGKTKTLVEHVLSLVNAGEDPRAIVVLTYSNKAAGELAARLAALNENAAAAMWIGTFHAFGFNLTKRLHKEMGYASEPRLIDRSDALRRLLEVVASLDLKHYRDLYDPTTKLSDVLAAISRAQDEVTSADRYDELARAMMTRARGDTETLNAERALEVSRVYRCYEEIKHLACRVDFGDLIAGAVSLLEARNDIRQLIRNEYHHVVVDEYQDVNHASVRLLQALTLDGRNLWCVGDARQSIYRFRGASSFSMIRFADRDFPGGRELRLEVTYRSTAEIVQSYSAFSQQMPTAQLNETPLRAHRLHSGKPVELHAVPGDSGAELDSIARNVEDLRREGYSYRDQALLCAGNDRLAKVAAGLEARGIPVLYLGSLFERPEVRDLLSWLSLLVDRRAMGLARRTPFDGCALSLNDVDAILTDLRETATEPLGWCREDGGGQGPPHTHALSRYAKLFHQLGPDSNPWEALALVLLDRSRLAAAIASAQEVSARAKGIAIWQFMNFVRAHSGGNHATRRLLDRIRRLVLLSDERDLRHLPETALRIDAVRLMTMHGSKGLEFPVVHIPGMNQNTLPRSPQPARCPPPDGMIEGSEARGQEITNQEHRDEQECLFYVALSRAQDRLLLYAPTETVDGKSRPLSEFIGRLGGGVARPVTALHLPGFKEETTPAIGVSFAGDPVFAQAHLALYERCPRRFFYTHVLQIGGRRVSTHFTEMHDVVRKVTDELAANPGYPVDDASLSAMVDKHWRQSDLAGLPATTGYRRAADTLIAYFLRTSQGGSAGPPEELRFTVPGATIVVKANQVLVEAAGSKAFRQVRTGHASSTFMKSKSLTAFSLAVAKGAPGCRAEIVFLADEVVEVLKPSAKSLPKHESELASYVGKILSGDFPPTPSSRTCPNCPAFFVCGPVPEGRLLKISSQPLPV